MKSALVAMMVCGVVSACNEDRSLVECGEHGALVALEGEQMCAYKQPIVIETGFMCPSAYPYRQDFESFSVCRTRNENLDGGQVDEVEVILSRDFGWSFDWKGKPGVTPPVVTPEESLVTGDQLDVLFVIDNSFSMCEEQKVLRDNLQPFLGQIATRDFHIGITTTHAPQTAAVIEPIASEGLLQSIPQPVPGNHVGCVGDVANDYEPLRDALKVAVECLENQGLASQFDWSTEQIECALLSPTRQSQTGCVASSGLPDRSGESRYDVFDLFPDYEMYRKIPKVIKKQDYLVPGGDAVDLERLNADLRCAMTVGTRGDGYEKGLRVAVKAVSPELTGVIAGMEGVDTSAPNYGFIRPNTRFSVFFITDENDCSHDGSIEELGNACGSNICEYMNSQQIVDAGQSSLIPTAELASELLANLTTTKQEDVSRADIFVASIHGTSKRYNEPFPICGPDANPEIPVACESALGRAYSGDRYERFMRQFPNFYPNTFLEDSTETERLDFSRYEPLGWMCVDTFAPGLLAAGEFMVQ